MPHRDRAIGFAAFAGLALALSKPAQAATTTTLDGWWLDGTGRAGIRFERCGGAGTALCGSIHWLRHPITRAGLPEADILNKDERLRGRRVCGMPLLGGFVADTPGHWSHGWIYNPDDGETYRSTMTLADDGTLHVRGYVGIALFGKSEIWTRPAAALQPCA